MARTKCYWDSIMNVEKINNSEGKQANSSFVCESEAQHFEDCNPNVNNDKMPQACMYTLLLETLYI
jgi:hypothetical protein